MDISTIIAIILGIFVVITSVSWAVLANRAKAVWESLQELKIDYEQAAADGVITDAEKAKIADTLIIIIGEATSIWQALQNAVMQILLLIRRNRIAVSSARIPPKPPL